MRVLKAAKKAAKSPKNRGKFAAISEDSASYVSAAGRATQRFCNIIVKLRTGCAPNIHDCL